MEERRVELLLGFEVVDIKFEALRKGNIFCLYDGDEIVCDEEGRSTFECMSDVFIDDGGILCVNAEGLEEIVSLS